MHYINIHILYFLLATGQWYAPDTPVSSTNKTDHHDIAKLLLKVALNTINQTKPYIFAFIKMVEKREGQPIMYNPERYGQHLAQDTKRRQIYKKSSFGVKLNIEVYNLCYSRFVAYTCHLCCFVYHQLIEK